MAASLNNIRENLDSRRAEAVATLRAVTQLPSDSEALALLSANQWNLEQAVNAFLSPSSTRSRDRDAERPTALTPSRRVSSPSLPIQRRPFPRWIMIAVAPLRFVWTAVIRVADLFAILLGGPARAIESSPGDTPHRRFLSFYQSRYGEAAHPELFDGSYLQALAAAQEQLKFLLVYLHSESHPHTRTFCSRVMSDTAVISFANENFICWAGSISQADGAAVQQALRVHGYPFLGIVSPPRLTIRPSSSLPPISPQNYGYLLSSRAGAQCLSPDQQMSSREGREGESEIVVTATISWMQAVLNDHGHRLDATRRERYERESARRLRQEQDQEFARSLEADRARERALREEEESRKAEHAARQQRQREEDERAMERETRRHRKRQALPLEPEKGPGVATIVMRLPEGERVNRRFSKSVALEEVFDWAEVNSVDIEVACLVSSYPRRRFRYPEDAHITLEDAGFFPSAMLLLEERIDDE